MISCTPPLPPAVQLKTGVPRFEISDAPDAAAKARITAERKILYQDGAIVGDIHGPDDAGDRTLSMKVYTMRDADGDATNRLGITDITDIGNADIPLPETQFIDWSQIGPFDITFPGKSRRYIVNIDFFGGILLTRAGKRNIDGTGYDKASIIELSAARDEQILKSTTTMIDGQPFYIIGQGGPRVGILFFSQAQMHAAPTADARPELMGDVPEAGAEGGAAVSDLGTLPDGTRWHLNFDPQTKTWDVISAQRTSHRK